MSVIQYTLHEYDTTIVEDVLNLLESVNDDFIPPLSQWVDLREYACKIAAKSVCWLAYENKKVVGLAACYVNESPLFSFWTMLAIHKEYRNRLIALQLESKVIAFCREKGSAGIQAEVDPRHDDLIKLHQHFGFKSIKECTNHQGRSWVELQLTF